MRRQTEARRSVSARVAAPLLLCVAIATAQDSGFDWIDDGLLEAREVQLDFGEDPRFRGRLRAAIMIDASPERIWDVLRDCAAAPEYLDSVLRCELIETLDGGRAQVFRQRARLRWFLPSFEHEFRLDYEPYRRITVSRVGGPIERLEAAWTLEPIAPSRTRVSYVLDIEPGGLIPNFLLSGPLQRDVLNAMRAVRDRAEAAQQTA
ncbi:MAG TPA: SRPBCC family protein [Gammaproteobacteria bacterium]|nr:SRPBCC family protein [Gammaproteobacteria bacterium]